ncbi:MAG: SufD family Fe-S cluster assembly protein [Puniceicoccales bacterium]|nr:SufD family Fe-S cluster assembly protein [Puniceicoccales bacterium]
MAEDSGSEVTIFLESAAAALPAEISGELCAVDGRAISAEERVTIRGHGRLRYILHVSPGEATGTIHRRLRCELVAPGASAEIFVLLHGKKKQRLSLDLHLHHGAGGTHSASTVRAVADGGSHLKIISEISSAPKIGPCSAAVDSRNLLLAPTARLATAPVLSIHGNGIACTHGATIGGPRPDELFYLRSRGICEEAAKELLCAAFSSEILSKIPTRLPGQII